MNILTELTKILKPLLPVETAIFKSPPPAEYAVLTPMTDTFAFYADNSPMFEVSTVSISFFCKGSYTNIKNKITAALIGAEFTIKSRRYIAYEADTGYHHYAIECGKHYSIT
ncbi:MAG: hypothetical protein FWH17_10470 [Oscillospiraceae bacterium]|nr:hypothetical protein [Oscillospiraceae bacterium]